MNITSGKIQKALKVVVYGPEGIGKTTFAAQFPDPVFIDTEGGTSHLDVKRTDAPSSWTMLMEQVRYFTRPEGRSVCKTLIVDTADWAEQKCANEVCAKYQKKGIEDFGYGKGYTYLQEEFGRLLNLLEEVISAGINVVVTAHAKMRKFEQPDEMGSYDRWEMKLSKQVGPMVKEWADMVLFANYKTYSIAVDEKGQKRKAQGGKRVMYTTHHPCWDAKNRQGLAEELPFDFAQISHCIAASDSHVGAESPVKMEEPRPEVPAAATTTPPSRPDEMQRGDIEATKTEPARQDAAPPGQTSAMQALRQLLQESHFLDEMLQKVVASRGYYPESTPISSYDPTFIEGWIIPCWPKIVESIENDPDFLPF